MAKAALVTGSSSGIGKGIALRLAKEGYDIGINCERSFDKAELVAEQIREMGRKAVVLKADIGILADQKSMFDEFMDAFGRLDVLVNNAGVTRTCKFLDAEEEMMDQLYRTNFKGHYFATQRGAKEMISLGIKGAIINITSIHHQTIFPETSIYGSLKSGLAKLTKHTAMELAPYGIRVNAIAPGLIDISEDHKLSPREEYLVGHTPLQRCGYTDEIAEAVMFLISEKASFMTGSEILMDGGKILPSGADNIWMERVVPEKV